MRKKIILGLISSLMLVSCNINDKNENQSVTTDPQPQVVEKNENEKTNEADTDDKNKSGNKSEEVNKLEIKLQDNLYNGTYYKELDTTSPEKLKTSLNTIINAGYQRFSYATCTKKLQTIDSYDGHYVECLYTGQRMDPLGSGANAGQWNKEHIWAKTYGFKDEKYDAYSDLQMLRVAEASINGKRSDKYFDYVSDTADSFGCKTNSDAFEPRDEVKGDVARIMFYMTVKYNDTSTLNLELTDDVEKIKSSAKVKGGDAYLGKLSTLLKWSVSDPVDEREISRNNKVFEIQKNRNPFIDHPELMFYLYNKECKDLNIKLEDVPTTCTKKNDEEIAKINKMISEIGEVTLDSKEKLDNIQNYYDSLDQVTKSFVTGFEDFQTALYKYFVLEDISKRDTTISTELSLLGLSSKTGSVVKNGVNIDYAAPMADGNYGLYAQFNNPLTLTTSNLYEISSISLVINSNGDDQEYTIEITDGTKSVSTTGKIGKNKETITLSVEEFDYSKSFTITVTKNAKSKSIIVSQINFIK